MGLFVRVIDLHEKCEKRKQCIAKYLIKRRWRAKEKMMHKISNLHPWIFDTWKALNGAIKGGRAGHHHSHLLIFFLFHFHLISLSLSPKTKERKKEKEEEEKKRKEGHGFEGSLSIVFTLIFPFLFA